METSLLPHNSRRAAHASAAIIDDPPSYAPLTAKLETVDVSGLFKAAWA